MEEESLAETEDFMAAEGSEAIGDDMPPSTQLAEEQQAPASSEESAAPMTYGEQLIWEMTQRYKGRPYDRKRTEELARPRRPRVPEDLPPLPTPRSKSSQDTSASKALMTPDRLEQMVKRLASPRKIRTDPEPSTISLSQMPYGEALVQKAQMEERAKRIGFDLQSMVNRLASPRRRSETPDAAVPPQVSTIGSSRLAGAPVDFARLAAMAKPTRRGASCTSWHVTPKEVASVRSSREGGSQPRSAADGGGSLRSIGSGSCAFSSRRYYAQSDSSEDDVESVDSSPRAANDVRQPYRPRAKLAPLNLPTSR
mmetsp:Transcript_38190/g.89606  ORF Transcript_38190/g.89606 Transcript_38190/m.89606 type:complete len:311 (-) Transcript_38190:128-1060(-)